MTATRGKFALAIHNQDKTDNTSRAEQAKVTIRRHVLQALDGDTHVFDAFAGEGHMHDAVWADATSYIGCDMRFFRDSRLAYVADNRRVLRSLDLRRFNIVDLDAYGSPWEQVYILASRRTLAPGERLGLILTEGTALKLKMGGIARGLSLLSGVKAQSGLGRMQDEVIDRALLRTAAMMGATIRSRWQATGKTGSRMIYCGVVLQGRGGNEGEA